MRRPVQSQPAIDLIIFFIILSPQSNTDIEEFTFIHLFIILAGWLLQLQQYKMNKKNTC